MNPRALIRPDSLRFALCGSALLFVPCLLGAATFAEADALAFTDRHCSSCHNDVDKEGGLDLTSLTFNPAAPENFITWVKVHDRVQGGEMPPPEKKRPAAADLAKFVGNLSAGLVAHERQLVARQGRATQRRMNRDEYENALQDLLQAPWLQVKGQFPEDGEAHRFNKIGDALDVSYVQMARFMSAADTAMRQVMAAKLDRPPATTKRYYARDQQSLTAQFTRGLNLPQHTPDRNTFPALGNQAQPDVRWGRAPLTVGDSDPETRNLEAVGFVACNYVTGFTYRWDQFKAPVSGRYKIRFSGYTMWMGPGGHRRMLDEKGQQVNLPRQWYTPDMDTASAGRRSEPITVYTRGPVMNRRLGAFDLHPEATVSELDVILLANEAIVPEASRFYRSRPTGRPGEYNYTNPLAQRDGAPAVAFRWMEVEGPLYDDTSTAGYELLFDNLELRKLEAGQKGLPIEVVSRAAARGGRRGGPAGGPANFATEQVPVEVVTDNPMQDAERLLRRFMARAYRRPVVEADVQRFMEVIRGELNQGIGFAESMLTGYTAVLASPGFVVLEEKPGRLDDYALASRLSFFLWNSEPDLALRTLAARGELRQPAVLRAQAERLLNDPKAQRFVQAFLNYWLDVRKMEETTPSNALYNDYYLDDMLTEAALAETQLFFDELLRRDLPARNIVDSDFTFANEHLAGHYGLKGVKGVAMRRISLPADSPRGGFMTHASVLKVTANGTTTSPVMRGKWIMERILGYEVPLPPATVPAVEPDIRGAVTIRQQLDKHSADESCASCHRKIDPPGFALESFDVMGAWRDRYRGLSDEVEPVVGFGKNGHPFAFHYARPAESSGRLPDGRPFANVRDFKRLILEDEVPIARNLAKQLTIYATGAPIIFSDRLELEQIIHKTKARGYGVRSIVHEIIQSELFLTK
jgi:hypothetical protein